MPGDSPCRNRTKKYRDYHASRPGSLAGSVRSILAYMRTLQLDLPLLLWAMSYNVPELVSDELVKFERTALLSSTELLSLLRTWHTPPRGHARGVRSKGASAMLDAYSLELCTATLRTEMGHVGTYMRTRGSDLSAETLLSIKISEMQRDVRARAPLLWGLLRECSWSPRQQKENKAKDPESVCTAALPAVFYSPAQYNIFPAGSLVHDLDGILHEVQP